jgi:hypothetical protein
MNIANAAKCQYPGCEGLHPDLLKCPKREADLKINSKAKANKRAKESGGSGGGSEKNKRHKNEGGNKKEVKRYDCKNCSKKDVVHKQDDCFSLEKNASKRPKGWIVAGATANVAEISDQDIPLTWIDFACVVTTPIDDEHKDWRRLG